MPLATGGRDAATNGLRSAVTHMSLHTADPSTTGANEVSGGGYARQACAFGASSAGVSTLTGTETFAGPASSGVSHIGLWASTTFLGSDALGAGDDLAFNAAGQYVVTGFTITTPA